MMKRWMAMGMALCLTAASLAGCSGTKDAAESTQAEAETSAEEAAAEEETAKESDLDKLTFTYVTSPLNVPTIIEKNQGIFEKTFGDMGIEVDYAELTSGADQTQALASRRCAGFVCGWRYFGDSVCSKWSGYQGIKYVQPFSEGILYVF